MITDLVGEQVDVVEYTSYSAGTSGYAKTGVHPGKIRAVWISLEGREIPKFLVEEGHQLIVRLQSELEIP